MFVGLTLSLFLVSLSKNFNHLSNLNSRWSCKISRAIRKKCFCFNVLYLHFLPLLFASWTFLNYFFQLWSVWGFFFFFACLFYICQPVWIFTIIGSLLAQLVNLLLLFLLGTVKRHFEPQIQDLSIVLLGFTNTDLLLFLPQVFKFIFNKILNVNYNISLLKVANGRLLLDLEWTEPQQSQAKF